MTNTVTNATEHHPLLDGVLVPMAGEWSAPVTLREFLRHLLVTLWAQGEGFSSKRPLGYSSWQYDVYRAVALAGLVGDDVDPDDLTDAQVRRVDELLYRAIGHVFA